MANGDDKSSEKVDPQKILQDVLARKELAGSAGAVSKQPGFVGNLVSQTMRKLKGYKTGGKVKKTGPAKLHKGEFVVKAPAAKKAGPQKLKALNQSQRDIAMLKRKKA